MVRKKIDSRIRTLIENGVKTRHRTFFVIVGDNSREQVPNLHYMLSKAAVRARPSVLWCYKKELGFVADRAKRNRLNKKKSNDDAKPEDDAFNLFISGTNIRYCFYNETENILGNTFGMCVLQDFEAIQPNILARTIETVEGGGIVVLLLKSMTSLRQLTTIAMDVHARYRTAAHQDVVARFNERFLLSLGSCKNCLVVDDQLTILPLSTHARAIEPVPISDEERADSDHIITENEKELKKLKASLKDTQPVGTLISAARTLDQAKAILTFVEAISEKTLKNTVALTAGRGRGKSAALGIAIAGAIAYGYSNIFVTSPSPENLKTLFEFIFKGFDLLEYKEHLDYEIVQSTNPHFHKAVVRVNIFRQHRQTIQYIAPQDANKLGQAELVVIDEAAAIPLPLVKKLLGPYLVFMASTINGYEGTGRSLSLKLIQQLREQNKLTASHSGESAKLVASGGRVLREISLDEPIRYAPNDPVEKWLNDLLCLDAASYIAKAPSSGCPHPSECELYYVNRDTLFSYHKTSEIFLHKMMALYVSSHYKNSPNDLQLMSDAPAHHLFVLLGPLDESQGTLPEILCVVQLCIEGEISKETLMSNLGHGTRPEGDLIPYVVTRQFNDDKFASLSGGRIVRIATHPEFTRMGYGTRAIELLTEYYQGKLTTLDDNDNDNDSKMPDATREDDGDKGADITKEKIKPRKNLPPLLHNLKERKPESLDYLGTSFGLTQSLFNFWSKSDFLPVYIRLNANNLTGEHSCIMLKPIQREEGKTQTWMDTFYHDFRKRFTDLLSYDFREFNIYLALNVLKYSSSIVNDADDDENKDNPTAIVPAATKTNSSSPFVKPLTKSQIKLLFSASDIKRLEAYSRNLSDYYSILDMVPSIAAHTLLGRIPVSLSPTQSAILLGVGLQRKSFTDLTNEDKRFHSSQVMSQFNKVMRKVVKYLTSSLKAAEKDDTEENDDDNDENKDGSNAMKSDEEDGDGTEKQKQEKPEEPKQKKARKEDPLASLPKVEREMLKFDQQNFLKNLNKDAFKVGGTEEQWREALKSGTSIPSSLSIKSNNDTDAAASGKSGGGSDKKKPKRKHGSMYTEKVKEGEYDSKKKKKKNGGKKH